MLASRRDPDLAVRHRKGTVLGGVGRQLINQDRKRSRRFAAQSQVLPNDFQAASQSIIDGKPLVLEHQDIGLSDAIRGLVGLYSNRALGGVEEPARGEHKSSLFGRLFG